MTIKQVIIGTVIGATAVAIMIHRLPKSPSKGLKNAKAASKVATFDTGWLKKSPTPVG